jgi:NTP pyrophosphatase (non-canonical NTP hydrolase)
VRDGGLNMVEDVAEFLLKYDIADPMADPEYRPEHVACGERLIRREFAELIDALSREDLPGIGGELCDVIWGCLALGLRLGLPMAEMWEAIAEANMAKEAVHKPDGGVSVVKPSGWRPPGLKAIVDHHASLYQP